MGLMVMTPKRGRAGRRGAQVAEWHGRRNEVAVTRQRHPVRHRQWLGVYHRPDRDGTWPASHTGVRVEGYRRPVVASPLVTGNKGSVRLEWADGRLTRVVTHALESNVLWVEAILIPTDMRA